MYMYNNMLTSKQKEFYKENGFLKLEGLFDPEELDKLATEYEQLFEVKTAFFNVFQSAFKNKIYEIREKMVRIPT